MPNWSDFEPYLRGDMLPPNKKITVTIERVAIEETHPKGGTAVKTPVLYFKGKQKGMPLSTMNTRTMRLLFGDDMNKAIGQKIIIRCEPKRIANQDRTPIYIYPAEEKAGEGEVTPMTGLPKRTPLKVQIDLATLPAALRERAYLAGRIYRAGGHIDAQYMAAAADEIERLRAEIVRLTVCNSQLEPGADVYPCCSHGVPIPTGAPAKDYCLDCFMDSE